MVWTGKHDKHRSKVWFLYLGMDSEDQGEQKSLSKLEQQVE